jgi:hypothetical protein
MNQVALSFLCCSFQSYEVNTHKITLSGSVRDANIVKYGVKKKHGIRTCVGSFLPESVRV